MSKKTPLRPAIALGECRHVGDAGVRDDQRRLGVALHQRREPGRDRRQAAAAVDQDRHAPLGGEREHRAQPLVGRAEALGPRVELDPARAGVEAADGLLERRLVQVEADERDQAAVRAGGEGERPVVRGAERRMAVGLVEAEHERARDAVRGHGRLELVVVADHPVDVVPEVEVRVEDVRAGRQEVPHLVVVACAELERACVASPRLKANGPPRLRRTGCAEPGLSGSWAARSRDRPVPRPMADVLIYADTVRSPELRHEVPITVPDPFLYVERNGNRHIVVSSMEIPRLEELGGFELHPLEEFGLDELRRSGISYGEMSRRARRAGGARPRRRAGDRSGLVPGADR